MRFNNLGDRQVMLITIFLPDFKSYCSQALSSEATCLYQLEVRAASLQMINAWIPDTRICGTHPSPCPATGFACIWEQVVLNTVLHCWYIPAADSPAAAIWDPSCTSLSERFVVVIKSYCVIICWRGASFLWEEDRWKWTAWVALLVSTKNLLPNYYEGFSGSTVQGENRGKV